MYFSSDLSVASRKRTSAGYIRTGVLFGVVFILLLSSVLFLYSTRKRELKLTAEAQITAVADLKHDQILQWRTERLSDAAVFGKNRTLWKLLQQRSAAKEDLVSPVMIVLRAIASSYHYRNALLFDTAKRLVVSTLPDSSSVLYRECVAAFDSTVATGSATMTDLYLVPGDRRIIQQTIFSPVMNPAGDSVCGVLVLTMNPADFLFPIIQDWPMQSATAEVLIVRPEGDSIVFCNELRHRKNTALTMKLSKDTRNLPAAIAVRGYSGVVEGRDYRGTPVLAAVRHIEGSSWYIVAKVDSEEAFVSLQQLREQLGIVLFFLLIAFVLALVLYTRNRTSEVYKKMYTAAQEKNRLAESLKDSELRFTSLFESMAEGVALHELIVDDGGKPCDYRIVDVNASFVRQTGITVETARGARASTLYCTEPPPYFKEYCAVVKSGTPLFFQTYFPPMKRFFAISVCSVGKNGFATVFEDVTERIRTEEERDVTIRLLSILNMKNSLDELLTEVSGFLQAWSKCEAVGIRLKKNGDFPYCETTGFPAEFVRLESSLCSVDADGKVECDDVGNPILECMCGNIIKGRFDPSKPFFTKRGSFWTNGTTDLLASTSEADRQARTRNRCNGEGYESVALVRLEFAGAPLGLLQVNDRRKNCFTPQFIEQLERFADNIAIAIVQRSNQKDLALEKERLLVTLRSIGDGVISTDTAGNILLMNTVAEAYTGFRAEDAVGRPLQDVFHVVEATGRTACSDPVKAVLASHTGAAGLASHCILVGNDGVERFISDSGAPIRDSNGNVIGVVLVFRDITEKQKAEAAIQKTERLESLGILAAGIAHDFNNLLSGLFGYLDLARECSAPGSDAVGYLDKAFTVFGRTKDLTGQLLTFAKGGAPARRTKQLTPLIRDAVTFALSGSSIKCDFTIDDDLWTCDVDENQLSQVIDNLIINARDAMPGGGTVYVAAGNIVEGMPLPATLVPGRYVFIKVRDEGCGIESLYMQRIFDPFFTTKQKGSGLGLAVAFSILQRHGGTIEADSEPGKGTEFRLYIPASEKSGETISPSVHHAVHRGDGEVLVMDDEEYIREIADAMFSDMGYHVTTAESGEALLTTFAALHDAGRHIAFAVLDLTVPGGMGGLETAKELLKTDPSLVLIASSGYAEDPVIAQPEKFGFSGAISKPYHRAMLEKMLDKVFAMHAHA